MNETVMLIRVNNYATSYIFGLSGVNYQGCVTKFNINIADVEMVMFIQLLSDVKREDYVCVTSLNGLNNRKVRWWFVLFGQASQRELVSTGHD